MSNEEKTNKLQCEIVKDLLPLYHDEVVSEVTKKAVKSHLDECSECSAEYHSLCEALPLNTEENTSKTKYNKMAKKLKLKKILWCTMILGITIAVISAIAYFLLMLPIIPAGTENIEVIKIHRYIDNGEDKLLLIYSIPHYSNPSYHNPEINFEDGEAIIDINLKHSILIPYEKEAIEYPWAFNHVFTLEDNCSVIRLGDEIIWSKEENADDEVPDYVTAFDDENVCSFSSTDNYEIFGFTYTDGRKVHWNLEGELLYDEYPDENGDYPEFTFE